MNKIMVLASIVAVAACSHAASINWSASNISAGNGITWSGNPTTKGNGYQAYFFITASTLASDADRIVKYDDIVTAAKAGQDISAKAYGAKTTSNGAVTANAIGTGGYGIGQDDTLSGFMVVFDNKTPADAGFVGISDIQSATVKSGAAGASAIGFSSYTATYGWTAVAPEPTSGMLLLLGVAGLALRRRRA